VVGFEGLVRWVDAITVRVSRGSRLISRCGIRCRRFRICCWSGVGWGC
jgi:hypothetical protein